MYVVSMVSNEQRVRSHARTKSLIGSLRVALSASGRPVRVCSFLTANGFRQCTTFVLRT